jgi:hypothetical protein
MNKAMEIAKLLGQGYSVKTIKKLAKSSESYIYMVKKMLANNVDVGTSKTVKETILSVANTIFPEAGEYIVVEGAKSAHEVDAILNQRASTYGAFATQAKIAQGLKHVAHTTANELGKAYDADQAEALDMIFSKIARIVNGNSDHADSWVDIAGYATLVADRLQGKVR